LRCRLSGVNRSRIRPGTGLSVANDKISEVLVLCDENAILVPAERQEGVVIGAAIGLEHVVDIMPCIPKRGDQAWIAALVEQ
jgi:hypothetical protein